MFKDKIRYKDIKSIILLSIAFPFSVFLKEKKIWLLSERPNEARDNAYVLYKYIQTQTKRKNVYYLIMKDSPDLNNVKEYGNIVYFNSFKHYVYYLASTIHISAHVDLDSPNSRVTNFLETHGVLKNKRVFLQHGITKDKISFGYYNVCRADLFVCAAKQEYEFCKKEFGFPNGNVQLLGFPRFDNLWRNTKKRQILLMPTWRSWLAKKDENDFMCSEYYLKYNELLSNEKLITLLEKNDIKLLFLPHSDMKKFMHCFKSSSPNLEILHFENVNIQDLIIESAMLITDYSSVAFDFAYMNKPIIYYQFDYNEYRKNQHAEGYFSYEDNGFGPVFDNIDDICNYLQTIVISFNNDKYENRVFSFFNIRDKNNCERVYKKILELEKKYG